MDCYYIKNETISISDSGWKFDFIKIAKVLRSVISIFDEILMPEFCMNIKCNMYQIWCNILSVKEKERSWPLSDRCR